MRPEKIEFEKNMPGRAFVRSVEYYPYHWHDALEIIQVLKGRVYITLGNKELQLKENDLAVINMDELHRFNNPSQDNEILFIQIDSAHYRRLLEDDSFIFLYCCSAYHEVKTPQKYEKLRQYIARLIWALADNSPEERRICTEKILKEMLPYLTYNFDFLRWGYGTVAFDEKQVERLKHIAKLVSNTQVKLGLKDLAAETNISLQHLSNNIKEKFGKTFLELLYYSKCEQAAKMLLSTQQRVVDIALECGFSDPKYLIKHFKKNFEHTPSEFRKKFQEEEKAFGYQALFQDLSFPETFLSIMPRTS